MSAAPCRDHDGERLADLAGRRKEIANLNRRAAQLIGQNLPQTLFRVTNIESAMGLE